eukprot:scaffold3112_cov136-Isochrysis_galbana.AAC.3
MCGRPGGGSGIGACLFGAGRVPRKPYRHLPEPSFLRLKGSLSTTPISIRTPTRPLRDTLKQVRPSVRGYCGYV